MWSISTTDQYPYSLGTFIRHSQVRPSSAHLSHMVCIYKPIILMILTHITPRSLLIFILVSFIVAILFLLCLIFFFPAKNPWTRLSKYLGSHTLIYCLKKVTLWLWPWFVIQADIQCDLLDINNLSVSGPRTKAKSIVDASSVALKSV